MNGWELLLLALVLWTAIGIVGTLVALARHDRSKARHGALWLAAVWLVYLAAELAVAKVQKQRIVAMGQEMCFDEMCFAVAKVEEVQGYFGRARARGEQAAGDGSRLLRVSVRIHNKGRGRPQSEGLIGAYLVDRQERQWQQMSGLSGVKLTALVEAGGYVMSEPVFKVPVNVGELGLVLTHGRKQPGALVIGDGDSLGHRPTVVWLHP